MSEASTICLKTWYTITPNACSVFIYILAISRISGVYSRAISKHIQLQKVSIQIIKHNTVKVTSSNRRYRKEKPSGQIIHKMLVSLSVLVPQPCSHDVTK